MKNTIKFLGIIAVVAIVGFSMAACGDGDDGPKSPGMPKVNATILSNTSIKLTWSADRTDRYQLFRNEVGLGFEHDADSIEIELDSDLTKEYTDTGLTPDKVYYYRIRVSNNVGTNESRFRVATRFVENPIILTPGDDWINSTIDTGQTKYYKLTLKGNPSIRYELRWRDSDSAQGLSSPANIEIAFMNSWGIYTVRGDDGTPGFINTRAPLNLDDFGVVRDDYETFIAVRRRTGGSGNNYSIRLQSFPAN